MGSGTTLERSQHIFNRFSSERIAKALLPQMSSRERVELAIRKGRETTEIPGILSRYVPIDVIRLSYLLHGLDGKEINTEFDAEMRAIAERPDSTELAALHTLLKPGESFQERSLQGIKDIVIDSFKSGSIAQYALISAFAPLRYRSAFVSTAHLQDAIPDYSYLNNAYTPTGLRLDAALYLLHSPHEAVQRYFYPNVDFVKLKEIKPLEYKEAMRKIGGFILRHQLYYVIADAEHKGEQTRFKEEPHRTTIEICPGRAGLLAFHEGFAMAARDNYNTILTAISQPKGYYRGS